MKSYFFKSLDYDWKVVARTLQYFRVLFYGVSWIHEVFQIYIFFSVPIFVTSC